MSRRRLLEIGREFQELGIEPTRENLLKQHYKLQAAHPMARTAAFLFGSTLIAFGVYSSHILPLLIALLLIGAAFVVIAIRGRRRELNDVVEIFTDTVGEGILSVIFSAFEA